MTCFECGTSFSIGDPPRAARVPEHREAPERVRDEPYAPPPVARADREPPRRARRSYPDDEEPATGRWLAVGICLFLLLVVLGGIGYLVWQAHSDGAGGRYGPTTIPAFRPVDRRDRMRDFPPLDEDIAPPVKEFKKQ
jgi:hypothetical protein